ncbi:PIN domain-containing protein [Arabiibacter massiliensis]|uniref:PIN domain-containing protein n=1 Tax=Arabiibacter massiliensis TaxID=1870985 RepID=UPI0009BA7C8F|nr:nucleotide-binding protein [Arabiibacter massiliensis]
MFTIIDETVILRYVLKDNKRHAEEAAAVIATGRAYTYPEIIARVAVTLRDVYHVPRTMIGETLNMLLDDICVSEEDIIRLACRYFGAYPLDFTDSMLVARNVLRGYRVKSFDKTILKRTLPDV